MGKIIDVGGNVHCVAYLTNAFGILTGTYTSGTNCMNLGDIDNSDTKTNPTVNKFKAEDGKVKAMGVLREIETNIIGMQSDKALLDFVKDISEAQPLLYYRYVGINNGNWQEQFSLCYMVPQFNLKRPGGAGSTKIDLIHVAIGTAISLTSGDMTKLGTAWGVTIHAPAATIAGTEEVELVETAVA